VDPNLVLAGFAATGLTLLGLGSLSILNSVWARKPRDAIVLTYLTAAAYLLLSGLSWILLLPPLGLAGFPWIDWFPVTIEDFVRWTNAGNIFSAVFRLVINVATGTRIDDILRELLQEYAVFHGLVAVLCAGWAVARLRVLAAVESQSRPKALRLELRLSTRT